MSIEIRNEKLINLSQAAGLFPPSRRGRPVHVSCLMRWIMEGVRTSSGRIRLDAIRVGGRWVTSIEAIERFAAAQTPSRPDAAVPPPSPASQKRASARAASRLKELGL